MFQIGVGQEKEEAILRCAIEKINTTNPFRNDAGSWKVLGLIYESATRYQPDTDTLIPYIAVGSANESHTPSTITWDDCNIGTFGYSPKQTWQNSSKPEIIIFYDFENVLWHDGVQMNIRDIMFSLHAQAMSQYNWLGHPLKDLAGLDENNYSKTQWLSVNKSWESEDGSRAALKFVLQKPSFSIFEYYLSSPILPYHIWGSKKSEQIVDNARIWCDPDYNNSNQSSWQPSIARSWVNGWPIGSGPFKWGGIADNQITLVSFRNHFYQPGYKYETLRNRASQPEIDGITLKIYNNENLAIMDLENDRLDYIAWGVSSSLFSRVINNPDLTYKFLKSAEMVHIVYNMGRKSFGYYPEGWQNPSSKNDIGKPLRKALSHCVDMVKINSLTKLAVDSEPLGLFNEWENASAPQYSFDPVEAMRILTKAGYLLNNSSLPPGVDNWWLNPDGSTIGITPDGRIEFLISEQEYDPQIFQVGSMLAYQMREIGLNVEMIPLEINILRDRLFNGLYDICLVKPGFQTSSLVAFQFGSVEKESNPPRYPYNPVPSNFAVGVSAWSPSLTVNVFDPDDDIMTVRFYEATTNTQIGIDQTDIPSGGTASVRWPGLDSLTTYTWYATADDVEFITRSPTWTFTTESAAGSRGVPNASPSECGSLKLNRSSNGVKGDDGHSDIYTLKTMVKESTTNGMASSEKFSSMIRNAGTRGSAGSQIVGGGVPRIYLQRPENFFYSSFHSRNVIDGPNFYGYQNVSFDRLIESAMASIDREGEVKYINDAAASLAYDVPYNRLYYKLEFEIYRINNFANYVDDGSGTLLNIQSMTQLKKLDKYALVAMFLSTPLTAMTNSTFPVKVRVMNQNGDTIAGAPVTLESSSGKFENRSGQTNNYGIFYTYFTAPYVPQLAANSNGTSVIIKIKSVSFEGYRDSTERLTMITVYPEGSMPMFIAAAASSDILQDRDSTGMPGFTYVDVYTTDQSNWPVSDVSISFEITGNNISIENNLYITDSEGHLRIKLNASDVKEMEENLITISASKQGFKNARQQISIMVIPHQTALEDHALSSDNNNAMYLAIAVFTATVLCIIYVWKRKNK